MCQYTYIFETNSFLGRVKLTASDKGLQSLDPLAPDVAIDQCSMLGNQTTEALLRNAKELLLNYLSGEKVDFQLPYDTHGTPFQQAVWNTLTSIPFGKTMTYKEIAEHIHRPGSSRAVGNAVGQNPIPILIPCHRVVGQNSLGGYSSSCVSMVETCVDGKKETRSEILHGIEMKKRLLQLEGISYSL